MARLPLGKRWTGNSNRRRGFDPRPLRHGEMAELDKAPVLNTGAVLYCWGFESLSLRYRSSGRVDEGGRLESGSAPGVPGVRIPPAPPTSPPLNPRYSTLYGGQRRSRSVRTLEAARRGPSWVPNPEHRRRDATLRSSDRRIQQRAAPRRGPTPGENPSCSANVPCREVRVLDFQAPECRSSIQDQR